MLQNLLCLLTFLMMTDSFLIASEAVELPKPINQSGTLSFVLKTDQKYFNGKGQEDYAQTILELPSMCTVKFNRNDSVVNITFTWEEGCGPTTWDTVVDFPILPGPEAYHLLFTWDSARGASEGYFNGQPLRIPGNYFEPWWNENTASEVLVGDGRLKIESPEATPAYLPPTEALASVPEKYRGKQAKLTGLPKPPEPIDVAQRRGKLLYESTMDSPASLEGWVAEGPLGRYHENGHLLMRSEDFSGHTVFWCPKDFPESFVAEWDFQPLSHYGLAIVFFAAKGEKGEDIFDPSLPARPGGHFQHYIKGAITSYHVSYFANVRGFQMGRTDTNLRKNNKFYRVGGGPVAVPPGAKGWQHIRLVKDRNRIQLTANGRTCVDWLDDNERRYGPPHKGGKIGLRQMAPTIGLYRNFRVWDLTEKEADY